MCRWLVLTLAIVAPAPASAQTDRSERDQVVAVVQQFFDSMAARDVALAKRVMVPEGRFFSTREDGQVRSFTNQEFIDGLPKRKEAVLERMWNPDVRIQGGIAVLWTRYDFYRDGAFSHCGVDAFDLVKTPEGWKISGGVYTVERTGCPPSPLGPPK